MHAIYGGVDGGILTFVSAYHRPMHMHQRLWIREMNIKFGTNIKFAISNRNCHQRKPTNHLQLVNIVWTKLVGQDRQVKRSGEHRLADQAIRWEENKGMHLHIEQWARHLHLQSEHAWRIRFSTRNILHLLHDTISIVKICYKTLGICQFLMLQGAKLKQWWMTSKPSKSLPGCYSNLSWMELELPLTTATTPSDHRWRNRPSSRRRAATPPQPLRISPGHIPPLIIAMRRAPPQISKTNSTSATL
jgi:hypothetical protein